MKSYISKIELVNSLINNIEFTQSQIINDSLFDIYVNAKCHNVPYNYFVKVFDNLFPQSVEYTEFIQNYCCPVKPGFRDFSSRNPSKYGT